MQNDFLDAVEKQIGYLQADLAPAGVESTHAEILDALIKAKNGNMQPLYQFHRSWQRLGVVLHDPNLPTPDSVNAEKDRKAAEDGAYRSARQDAALQSLLKNSMDAVVAPVLASVMYMLQVLGPIFSLMDAPESDE